MVRFSGERVWRRVRRVTILPQPAVQVDHLITVPAGRLWEPVAFGATLTTDATVANRAPRLVIGVDGSTVLDIVPLAVIPASTIARMQWRDAPYVYGLGVAQMVGFPPIVLPPGATIATLTDNLSAADRWSAATLYAIETQYTVGEVDLSGDGWSSGDDPA